MVCPLPDERPLCWGPAAGPYNLARITFPLISVGEAGLVTLLDEMNRNCTDTNLTPSWLGHQHVGCGGLCYRFICLEKTDVVAMDWSYVFHSQMRHWSDPRTNLCVANTNTYLCLCLWFSLCAFPEFILFAHTNLVRDSQKYSMILFCHPLPHRLL